MARFTGKKAKETPALNMGSMSDIISCSCLLHDHHHDA